MVFSTDKKNILDKNIVPKIQEFKNCLKQWQHHKLTLLGKITVIKSMALPKIIYPLTVLPNINDDLLNEITKAMFNFLWDNKPDKIKRKIIMQTFENGGFKNA